ncbi:GtrA family protein [Rickettsiales endosymbiont of Stachyamoeba lipophora]|uniref:GtrA family protein n=1 Tax=Rickettsiales endosymbiont of Stachyamoeba lipophora TaxID=2486578 RepID=UPI000F64FB4B|nr:GtrA family protein [Rickettsiales endosymbiont of Stachyamoeba lipophora]AZL16396.1 GtrA family protein [Rickettsiales endosymbiont of Stachyamoeba lipophora]
MPLSSNKLLPPTHKLLRFIVVGIIVTLIHASILALLVEAAHLAVLPANFIAFCIAFIISFLGHHHWSFKSTAKYRNSLPRFLACALLGILFNQVIMCISIEILRLNYRIGFIIIICVIPIITFIVNNFWAFKH